MKLLEELTQTPSIAGREDRLRNLIIEKTKGLFDRTEIDALGSLICIRKPRPQRRTKRTSGKSLRVMVAAHMDQIGFMVRHIDSKGFLRIQNVGGFDTRNLFARLVTVCTDLQNPKGDLTGVMNPSGRPLHIATDADKKKVPEVGDLVVDLGLPTEQVKQKVRIGDMIVIQAPLVSVGETVVGQCLDNRVACWLAIEAMKKLKAHRCEICVVFTSQEEVGCRGAGPAADTIQPDIAISLDTTLCVDTPGVEEDQRVTKQGEGVGLMIMDSTAISDLKLFEAFESLAAKHNIKAQRTILPRGGNDAATIQRKGKGFRVMTLVCPTRYIHTVTEMVHRSDLYAARDLLTTYLATAAGS